jgi:hypothetical protein
MAVNQMDVPLLADYVGMARWRVRRHLRPAVWRRLSSALRERYAVLFRLSPGDLDRLPARPQLPFSLPSAEKGHP